MSGTAFLILAPICAVMGSIAFALCEIGVALCAFWMSAMFLAAGLYLHFA